MILELKKIKSVTAFESSLDCKDIKQVNPKENRVTGIVSAPYEGEGREKEIALPSVVRVRLMKKMTSEQRPKGDKAHCRAVI